VSIIGQTGSTGFASHAVGLHAAWGVELRPKKLSEILLTDKPFLSGQDVWVATQQSKRATYLRTGVGGHLS
jgi:hypothetical protein